jgi:hypothetical protein
MGDRAVIGFKADKEAIPVFLYSHWGGSDRYRDAVRAIEAARPRWNDAAYATRIGISQIVENYWHEELGFGISAGHDSFCQPDYDDVILITWEGRTVDIVSAGDSTVVSQTFSFDAFLSITVMN